MECCRPGGAGDSSGECAIHRFDASVSDFAHFFVDGLSLFATTLQRWAGIPWPLTVLAFAPLAFAVLSVAVWFWRGTAWPVGCAYPTARNRPCKRLVAGEWYRCHDHRYRWIRKTDRHEVNPGLYRWQTTLRGSVRDRDDLQGRGLLRLASNRTGVLFYRGFTRPPRNIYWQPLVDWWRQLGRVVGQLRARRRMHVGSGGPSHTEPGVSGVLDSVILATRVTLVLVVAGLVLVLVGRLVWAGLESHGPRLALDYAATFLFIGAWLVVKNGLLETSPTWQRDTWSQTLKIVSALLVGLFLTGLLHIWAGILAKTWHTDIKQLILWVFVVWFFVLVSTQTSGKRKRRKRRR
jgi:hypothetical protein